MSTGKVIRSLVMGLFFVYWSLRGLRELHPQGAKETFIFLGMLLFFILGVLILLIALLALLRADERLITISQTLGGLVFQTLFVLVFGGIGLPMAIAGGRPELPARLAGVLFSLVAFYMLYRIGLTLRDLFAQISAWLRG